MDGIYKRICFSVVPFSILPISKMNIGTAEHIPISFFCLWIRNKEKEIFIPFSYFLLSNQKTKNEMTVYTTYGAFPFSIFHLAKEK